MSIELPNKPSSHPLDHEASVLPHQSSEPPAQSNFPGQASGELGARTLVPVAKALPHLPASALKTSPAHIPTPKSPEDATTCMQPVLPAIDATVPRPATQPEHTTDGEGAECDYTKRPGPLTKVEMAELAAKQEEFDKWVADTVRRMRVSRRTITVNMGIDNREQRATFTWNKFQVLYWYDNKYGVEDTPSEEELPDHGNAYRVFTLLYTLILCQISPSQYRTKKR